VGGVNISKCASVYCELRMNGNMFGYASTSLAPLPEFPTLGMLRPDRGTLMLLGVTQVSGTQHTFNLVCGAHAEIAGQGPPQVIAGGGRIILFPTGSIR
jgi:hypothetical protein